MTGTGRHRVQIIYFFRMQIGSRTPSGIGLGSGGRLRRMRPYLELPRELWIEIFGKSWSRAPERKGPTPKTIREVERCLLLVAKGRAEMKPELWAVSKTARSLRLLTRFVESGHEVIASHVLTMLGGPMEQMESWGPPGSNKRRPCRLMVTTKLWEGGTSLSVRATPAPMLLGIPENYHATD